MGIPTPTYYDQLLLTKCKLLLQAALANPKRKGGSYSWEEFVTGLDERDEGTIRTFEVLLQETAVRRPRKTTTTTTNEVAQVGGGNRRRGRTVIPVASRLNQRHFAASTIEESDDSSNSSDSDPPFEVSQDLERFLGVPPPRERVPENRPVGIPIDRTITTTTTTSSGGGAGIPSTTDPSQRLREHERGSLFGFDEPSPSFSELLNNIAAVANENETDFLSRSSRSHLSPIIPRQEEEEAETTPAEGEEDHYNSELPTFQELWQVVVTENEQQQQGPAARFPSESINSFDSFLNRLNSTLSNNNINPLTSGDMNGLLAELTLRDVSIPIRIRNAISRRRGGGSSSLRRRITEHLQGGQRIQTRDGGDESSSPLMEGIWRIQAGPAQVVVGSSSSSEGVRNTFSEFARRRRAITREREEEGGGGAIAGTATTSSSSNNETPTSSTTPVTSQAPSPISTCPPPHPPLAPLSTTMDRPLTSADRAIAAIRQQREIAPLPNSSTLTLTTTNGGAVPHEYRNRSNGDLARRNWIDNMIERGRRFLAEDEAMYGTTPTGEVPENEDARQAIERIRALTASRLETDGN
ncbi:hypothetical protein JCM3765_001277 [Sporobolomyces pararoseus]